MTHLLFLALALVLFLGFLALTRYEDRRGARVLAARRVALDGEVARLSFVASHVDFPAFIRDSVRALAARIAHDVAHASLLSVRFIERQLTRLVRMLRTRRAGQGASAGPSSFVATMTDFKQELRNGRKEEGTTE